MGKELPYFQFEPAEYLASDISLCSFGAQGLFINIQCLYWQKDCELKLIHVKRRFNQPELIKELIDDKIIKIDGEKVIINFLDEQRNALMTRKKRLSAAGKKGGQKRVENQEDNKPCLSEASSEKEATPNQPDKIRKENKRIDNNKINIICISFVPFFNDFDFQEAWIDFEKVREKKKVAKSERAYKSLMKKIIEYSGGSKEKAIKIVAKSADAGWTDLYELRDQQNNKAPVITSTNRPT